MTTCAKAPFPFFGAKSRIAGLVWQRLDPTTGSYVEPFYGTGAMLLGRPGWSESVNYNEVGNDADGFVANFWRAVREEPARVAQFAEEPVGEIELRARSAWLSGQGDSLTEMLSDDVDFYDVEVAGWWAWGQSAAILGSWLGPDCKGRWNSRRTGMVATDGAERVMACAVRMARVRMLCGDWSRCVASDTVLGLPWYGRAAVFLDPPYAQDRRASSCYRVDTPDVAGDVLDWCVERGRDERLSIALCGYAGEHDALTELGWDCVAWKSHGGMTANVESRGKLNSTQERVWFSPGCAKNVISTWEG